MRPNFMYQKPTGICVMCGRSTKLLVHQRCHDKDHEKAKKVRKMDDATITHILRRIPKD